MSRTGSARAATTCSIYWTGAASTSWNSGSNWSLTDGGAASGTTPSATDYVCMSTAPTRANVVAASGSRTVAGIKFPVAGSVVPSLTVQGGTLTLNTNDSVINNFSDTGTLAGSSNLTMTGTNTWSTVTVFGGTRTVAAGSSLTLSGTVTIGNGTASTPGVVTVNGTLSSSNVSLRLSTAPSAAPGSVLTIAGSSTWFDTGVATNGSGTVKPKLVVTGSLSESSDTDAYVDVPFTNNGSVAVTANTVHLSQGGASADTGTYAISSGATLDFSGGTRSISAGTVTGAGTLSVSGGTTSFASGVTVANLSLSGGGTVTGSPSVGLLSTNGGTLSGSGTMTVTGSGSTLCNVSLRSGYRLLNQGSMTYNSDCYYTYLYSASTIENAGSLTLSGGNGYPILNADGSANAVLNDAGATLTVNLTSSGGSVQIDPAFVNHGTVSTESGGLYLSGGTLAGQSHDGVWTNTASTGGGINVAGGTTAFGTGNSVPVLTLSGGTLTGSPSVGSLSTTGGTLSGSGTMTVTGTGSLCSVTLQSGYRLLNQGSMTDNTNCYYVYLYNGSTLENAGSFAFTGSYGYSIQDQDGAGNAVVNDAGATMTVGLTNSNSSASIGAAFTNNGSLSLTTGSLTLAQAGASADTGTYAISAGSTLEFSGGTRTVAAGTVSGAGTLSVSGGTTTFASGVTVTNLALNGGTVSGSPSVGTFTTNGGTLSGSGTMTVTGTGSLCSVTLQSGYRLLNQGSMTDNTNCYYVYMYTGSTLENAGTFTVSGGNGYSIQDQDGTSNAVVNDAGATMTVALSNANSGFSVGPAVTNNGSLSVTTGALHLYQGGSNADTGNYAISSGSTLDFAGGTRTVSAGTVSGAGTLSVSGGTTSFGNGVSVTNLALNGGTVSGSPSVATFTTNGGTLSGSGTMTVTGTGSLCSVTLQSGYRLLNQGSMTDNTGCYYVFMYSGSTIENAGTFTFTGGNGYSIQDQDGAGNAVVNDAGATMTVNLSAGSSGTTVGTGFTNNGTLAVSKGTLTLNAVSNISGAGALTGGTWNLAANGGLRLPRTITSNAATVTVTTGASLLAQTTGGAALATLASNSGALTLGVSVNGSVSTVNTGVLTLTAGTFRPTTYTQTSGSTVVAAGASLRAGTNGTGNVVINGGSLSGSGAVQGALSGSGTIVPGTSGAGTLTVSGPYTAAAGSTVAVTAGASSTTLAVTGAVSLNGTLAITTATPVPAVGTSFTLVSAGSRTGTFSSVTGIDVPSGNAYWSVGYSASGVTATLTAYPQVSVTANSTPEGNSANSTLLVGVSLSAPSPQPVTVSFSTLDGTAQAGSDYVATSGTLTFPAGSTSQSIPVTINGDTTFERDETFSVLLSTPGAATLGTASAVQTIVNDDAPPALSIADAGGSIDKNGGTTITFPVSLSAASGVPATVSYASSDGTAKAPTDYATTSGTLTIPAGATTGQIQVQVPAQPGYTAPKTFTMTLSNPVDAVLGTSTATGTITNTNQTGSNPVLTSLSPNLSAQGTTVTVQLNGSDLAPGATVAVSGTGVTVSGVSVLDSARIAATFTVSGTATVSARDVTVTVPGATPATCTSCFAVTARPSVTAPTRTAFALGNVDAVFSASGTNFGPGMSVSLTRGTKVFTATSVTVRSATSMTAVISIATTGTLGAYNVVVTNADGGTASCVNCVTIYAAPKLTAVSPSTITRGTSASMTFTGSGFVAGTIVSVPGCTVSNLTVVNATTIAATVTANSSASVGAKTVKVINPDSVGSGVGSKAGAVTIN